MQYKLTEEETNELVRLTERLLKLRDSSVATMTEGDDEKIRSVFKQLLALSEEFNDLYKRTIMAQMVDSSGDELGRCVGYHIQMTEALAITMAQLCMSEQERKEIGMDKEAVVAKEPNPDTEEVADASAN